MQVITKWGHESETIDSGYGKITYREWCLKEVERLNVKGDSVVIVERTAGSIALARR